MRHVRLRKGLYTDVNLTDLYIRVTGDSLLSSVFSYIAFPEDWGDILRLPVGRLVE